MDVFHKDQKPLNDEQKQAAMVIKESAEVLLAHIQSAIAKQASTYQAMGPEHVRMEGEVNRCGATAKTYLETAVMWAVKGVTK
jgi:hypothetical protein